MRLLRRIADHAGPARRLAVRYIFESHLAYSFAREEFMALRGTSLESGQPYNRGNALETIRLHGLIAGVRSPARSALSSQTVFDHHPRALTPRLHHGRPRGSQVPWLYRNSPALAQFEAAVIQPASKFTSVPRHDAYVAQYSSSHLSRFASCGTRGGGEARRACISPN
jgi:hypothetical protein